MKNRHHAESKSSDGTPMFVYDQHKLAQFTVLPPWVPFAMINMMMPIIFSFIFSQKMSKYIKSGTQNHVSNQCLSVSLPSYFLQQKAKANFFKLYQAHDTLNMLVITRKKHKIQWIHFSLKDVIHPDQDSNFSFCSPKVWNIFITWLLQMLCLEMAGKK